MSPVVEVDVSLSGSRVVEALGRAIATHGWPKTLCVDNDPEFSGRVLDQWAHKHKVKLHFSRPGKRLPRGRPTMR